jgi:hypothetical protein
MTEDRRQPRPETPQRDGQEFEFTDAQKESFGALAGSVIFLGVCALLVSGVALLGSLGALVEGYPSVAGGAVVGGLVYGFTAVSMLSAGRSLSAMLRTRGRDVALLMEAVTQLRRIFGLAVGMMLLVVAGGMAVAWCVATGNRCWGLF